MNHRLVFLSAIMTFVTAGCSGPTNEIHEVTGTAAERAAGVSRVIKSHAAVPSDITDAHLIEQQFGDGQLGPADYRSFVWIKVSPDDIAKWKSALKTPPTDSPAYDTPPTKPKWWLAESDYKKLTKYDSQALFDRHGWIAIEDNGNIYAHTYTQ